MALLPPGGAPALLLPDVARDNGLDRDSFLRVLLAKANAGRADLELGALFAFRTECVASHDCPLVADRLALGRAWLKRQID